MTSSLSLIWDDRFLQYDLGPGHPFREESRRLAVRLIQTEGFLGKTSEGLTTWVREIEPATRREVELFHAREYIDLVERLAKTTTRVPLDQGDTPSFPGCDTAAARIVGGMIEGVGAVESGRSFRAFHPAGGFHHAHPDRASGFCIYNDLAIAIARWLNHDSGGRKVAYVDIDAHHGDGVMYGFYDDGRVLDIDFHQDGRSLFPGTGFPDETGKGDGAGCKVNVPLPPGAGDEAFRPLFAQLVPPLVREFRPDLIILQHGVDAHTGDRLAALQYTRASYSFAVRTLVRLATEVCGGRIVVTGGGGYSPEHVALRLAEAALVLSDPEQTDESDRDLPDSWRNEFRVAFRTEAPMSLREPSRRAPSPWRAAHHQELIAQLSRNLGVRFPRLEQT